MIIDHAFDDYYRQIFRTISNHLDHRSAWTRSWRRRVSAKRSWRSSRWLRSRCPPSPPSCSWQSWPGMILLIVRLNEWVTSPACKVSHSSWSCATQSSKTCSGRGTITNDFWGLLSLHLFWEKRNAPCPVFWHLLHLYSFMAPLLLKEGQYLHSFAINQIIYLFKLWLLGSVLKRVRRPEKCRLPVSTGFAAASWHLFEVYDTSSLVRV